MSAFDRWLLVQKLYADMVADDGTVCIAYRVDSRFCGFKEITAGLEGIGICFPTSSSVPRMPNPNSPRDPPFETSASS